MLAGELYRADDPELVADAARAAACAARYNAASASAEDRHALLAELARIGRRQCRRARAIPLRLWGQHPA
ncbi:maltose acetyltransferase domain-containing protein [Novosphingobium rhizosphaerae]|uniref:maltose acetyltransferase domain-containing protein n=1 Tax=Novosphingobium rhizosphaerae TaxID=1551649 RepID=UPI003D81618B